MSYSNDGEETNLPTDNKEFANNYCEESSEKSLCTDKNYPDYSCRNRVNFLYTKIIGDRCKSINVCFAISKPSIFIAY